MFKEQVCNSTLYSYPIKVDCVGGSIYSTAQRYLALRACENCDKNFKKCTRKKLISMYEALFCITLCLTLSVVLDL